MKAKLISQSVPPERIMVIPNWADGSAIQTLPKSDNELRPAWGLKDKFIVAYSGNFNRAHDLRTVLGAMEAIGSNEEIVFLFIGDGNQRDRLEIEAQQRG